MAETIPDLWRANEEAQLLYDLYLCHSHINHLHERVIWACRQIRRFAARGPGLKEGLFTFSYEIDALCELREYKTAWRRLRRREEIVFGNPIDLSRHEWTAADAEELKFNHSSLMFFLKRFRQGCSLLETYLNFWFSQRKVESFELLSTIYNGDSEPSNRYRVTLSHFYGRLGKELIEWQHWEAFVNGFHPRLFRLASVGRDELLANSGKLKVFVDKLMQIRAERLTAHVSNGESDLIKSAATVRKQQTAIQQKLDAFQERIKPKQVRTNRKLEELFPELRGLLK
jgi:hypothetical protein